MCISSNVIETHVAMKHIEIHYFLSYSNAYLIFLYMWKMGCLSWTYVTALYQLIQITINCPRLKDKYVGYLVHIYVCVIVLCSRNGNDVIFHVKTFTESHFNGIPAKL